MDAVSLAAPTLWEFADRRQLADTQPDGRRRAALGVANRAKRFQVSVFCSAGAEIMFLFIF
jgi:hypothetical protein